MTVLNLASEKHSNRNKYKSSCNVFGVVNNKRDQMFFINVLDVEEEEAFDDFVCAGQINMTFVKHTSKDDCSQTNKPELEMIKVIIR